jgi:hypothetical protein
LPRLEIIGSACKTRLSAPLEIFQSVHPSATPDIEKISGLNLAMVKLTTVQVTKLSL